MEDKPDYSSENILKQMKNPDKWKKTSHLVKGLDARAISHGNIIIYSSDMSGVYDVSYCCVIVDEYSGCEIHSSYLKETPMEALGHIYIQISNTLDEVIDLM